MGNGNTGLHATGGDGALAPVGGKNVKIVFDHKKLSKTVELSDSKPSLGKKIKYRHIHTNKNGTALVCWGYCEASRQTLSFITITQWAHSLRPRFAENCFVLSSF